MHRLRRLARACAAAAFLAAPALALAEPAAPVPTTAAAPEPPPARPTTEPPPAPGAPAPDRPATRVVYLPETVKAELRDEIKREVLEQAKREGWAAPNTVPPWISRLRFSGEVRTRIERDLFSRGNANGGDFLDFGAVNAGKAFDVNYVDPANERYLNVDQNRTRPRLRARLGVEATIAPRITAGVRFATGESANPGSAYQTLGASGGFFSKYQAWFDRAWVRWDAVEGPRGSVALRIGRFENPFLASEMVFSPEVSTDGAALTASVQAGSLRPFFAAGAFPVYTTAFGFPGEQPAKLPSLNKWLYAGQVGVEWRPATAFGIQLAVAFYDFDKVEGHTSDPCETYLSYVTCSTDDSRPTFAQKGNSYMALRVPSARALDLAASSSVPQYEYFGLASRFREMVATVRTDLRVAPGFVFRPEVEYVRNAGFKKGEVAAVAINNRGTSSDATQPGPFVGGNQGYLVRLGVGTPEQASRGDWRVRGWYERVESDAVLDALNDQDFGLGGTNLKGYALDAAVYFADGLALGAKWASTNQVAGPQYGVDVFQLDFWARF